MNNVVTFFTKTRTGYEFEFKKKLDNIDYTIAIHTDKAFNHKELQPYPVTYETNINGYIDEITDHISQRIGGIIVTHYENNGKLHVEITTIQPDFSNNIDNYPVPEAVFYLEPGDIKLKRLPLDVSGTTKPEPLNIGSHIIIPVNIEAQEKFNNFIAEYTDWFPGDFQINLFNLLRNPSLSFRVNRLETLALASSEEKWKKNKNKPWYKQIPNWLIMPVYPAIERALLWLVLITILCVSLSTLYFVSNNSTTTSVASNKSAADKPTTNKIDTAVNTTIDESNPITDFLNTLKAEHNNKKLPDNLFEKHFSQFYNSPDNKLPVKADTFFKDKNALWGLLKLRVITDDKKLNDDNNESLIVLDKSDNNNPINTITYTFNASTPLNDNDKCWLATVISEINPNLKAKFTKETTIPPQKNAGQKVTFPEKCKDPTKIAPEDKERYLLDGLKKITGNLNNLQKLQQ